MFQDYRIAYLRKHVKIKQAVPLSFLRQSVAYMLSQSACQIPHAAAVTEYDVTPLIEYGKTMSEKLAQSDVLDSEKLLKRAIHKKFSAFILKSMGHVLYQMPSINAFLDYAPMLNGGTLYQSEDVNLSFTVHTQFGVMKPILRNPHMKTIETVAEEMRILTRKARRTDPEELYRKAAWAYLITALKQVDVCALKALWIWIRATLFPREKRTVHFKDIPESDKLQVEDILGATCTVANIGMVLHGHQTVTVIIPPEVAMFGVGDIHLAPSIVDGNVVPRYKMTVAGTIDHRAFDGGEIFPFAKLFKDYIDHPEKIYNWKPGDPV